MLRFSTFTRTGFLEFNAAIAFPMSSRPEICNVTASPVAEMLTLDEHHALIVAFGEWLRDNKTRYSILPPTTVIMADGTETMAFVLRQDLDVIGDFNTPYRALLKIGDARLLNAYYAHTRD